MSEQENKRNKFTLNLPEFDYNKIFKDINYEDANISFKSNNSCCNDTEDLPSFIKEQLTQNEINSAKRLSMKQEKEAFVDKEEIRRYFKDINNLLDQELNEIDK